MAVFGPIFTADNVTDGLVNMNDVLQFKYAIAKAEFKYFLSHFILKYI